jgi:DNA-binding transcriptional MerR regulator
MPLFRKELPNIIAMGKGIPTERVRELSSKGFSEPEVIDVLRKEGFTADDIDKALTQTIKSGLSNPQYPPTSLQQTSTQSELPILETVEPQMSQMPETSLPESYYSEQQYPTQEYVDMAVKDRVGEVDQRITEFEIRYEELTGRMQNLHEQLNAMLQTRTGEQQQILNKIESFGGAIGDMDARLSGLEKAFKETLPALIESVRALTDLVSRLKREG